MSRLKISFLLTLALISTILAQGNDSSEEATENYDYAEYKFLAETTDTATAFQTCPSGWTQNQDTGDCYLVTTSIYPWTRASAMCAYRNANAELASIRTKDENHFVQNLLNNTKNVNYAWIGGNDIVEISDWLWTDYSPVVFTDWAPKQPYYIMGYRCIMMNKYLLWKWQSNWCYYHYPSVCKIPNIKVVANVDMTTEIIGFN